MKILADMLHLLMCQHPHIMDMMKVMDRQEDCCYYYLENDIAGGETMPDHLKWYTVVQKFKTSLSLESDEEALNFVRSSIEIAQSIRTLADGNEGKMAFIKTVIM